MADAGQITHIDRLLAAHKIPAMLISGPDAISVDDASNQPTGGLRPLGDRTWLAIAMRIQRAMDPQEKFAAYPAILP